MSEVKAELRETPYDGKHGLIVGDHPHKGETGKCLGAEMTGVGWALRFKGNYNEFFVLKPEHVKWI